MSAEEIPMVLNISEPRSVETTFQLRRSNGDNAMSVNLRNGCLSVGNASHVIHAQKFKHLFCVLLVWDLNEYLS